MDIVPKCQEETYKPLQNKVVSRPEKIPIAISSKINSSKGKPTKHTTKKHRNSFEYRELSVRQIANHIKKGNSFAAGICINPRNGKIHLKSKYYKYSRILVLDFDSGNLQEMLSDPFIKDHAAFIYTTPSHTELNNRFRVVFILDKITTGKEQYKRLANILIDKYGTDKCSKNCNQIYYGMPEINCFNEGLFELYIINTNNRLNTTELLGFSKKESKSSSNKGFANKKNLNSIQSIEKLTTKTIKEAPDGEKREYFNKLAYTVGGLASKLELNEIEILDFMYREAEKRQSIESQSLARKTFKKGFAAGKQKPISFKANKTDSIVFPVCLLGYSKHDREAQRTIETKKVISNYITGKLTKPQKQYIYNHESNYGTDRYIEITKQTYDLFIAGKINLIQFICLIGYHSLIKEKSIQDNKTLKLVRQDYILYLSVGARSKKVYIQMNTKPKYTKRQIGYAFNKLNESQILYKYYETNRAVFYGYNEYFSSKIEFIKRAANLTQFIRKVIFKEEIEKQFNENIIPIMNYKVSKFKLLYFRQLLIFVSYKNTFLRE